MCMLALALHVKYVHVAALASLVAGELDRVGGDFTDGRTAIMPILAKALRHNKVAHHQKHQKGEDKESCKPEKMSCILEKTHQAPFP